MRSKLYFSLSLVYVLISCSGQTNHLPQPDKIIKTGAERTELYLSQLENKNIAFVGNHTSMINHTHVVDSLLQRGINIVKIFSPEHGFRGRDDAGKLIQNNLDEKTGLPVISLYGNKNKPSAEDLRNIDLVIFDIQDVGVRFYTYTSTLHYIMEACAENNIPLLVFDRPNPNGFYVDGPVLKNKYKSFVGMHPVPVVHGMTMAEYALMINGEGWVKNNLKCDLKYILCENYTHKSLYTLPVFPSPNIKSMNAVYLYPSVGLFEGTIVNEGRGTNAPFEVFGHPDFPDTLFSYIPRTLPGATNPKLKGKTCYGFDLRDIKFNLPEEYPGINLQYLITAYRLSDNDKNFFTDYFLLLSGDDQLESMIKDQFTEEKIKKSWAEDLINYKKVRKKYLLYPDFE
ncbi:MAG: DUF1343 domain-containing protein [Bacteroidales bacterium]|nr:DUF1343 domain-containing protein [Bacteroidales bacterium]